MTDHIGVCFAFVKFARPIQNTLKNFNASNPFAGVYFASWRPELPEIVLYSLVVNEFTILLLFFFLQASEKVQY